MWSLNLKDRRTRPSLSQRPTKSDTHLWQVMFLDRNRSNFPHSIPQFNHLPRVDNGWIGNFDDQRLKIWEPARKWIHLKDSITLSANKIKMRAGYSALQWTVSFPYMSNQNPPLLHLGAFWEILTWGSSSDPEGFSASRLEISEIFYKRTLWISAKCWNMARVSASFGGALLDIQEDIIGQSYVGLRGTWQGLIIDKYQSSEWTMSLWMILGLFRIRNEGGDWEWRFQQYESFAEECSDPWNEIVTDFPFALGNTRLAYLGSGPQMTF